MRWSIKRERDLYPNRGFAVLTNGGSLGFTYGEEGSDMFRSFTLTIGWWTWSFNLHWKQLD